MGQLTRDGQTVHLTPRAMDLLRVLADHAGEVVGPDELMDAVWADIQVAPETLYQAIGAIRRALGDDSHRPKYLETIPKRGYRLVASVRYESDSESGDVKLPARRWLSMSRSAGKRAAIAMTLIIAAAAWVMVYVDRRGVAEIQPSLSLAMMPAVSQSANSDEILQRISDQLVERLIYFDDVTVVIPDVPVYGGENLGPYVATGRSLGVDAVLILRADASGRTTLDVVDPESETLRASIPVDANVSDEGVSTDELILRLEQELDVAGSWSQELAELEGQSLDPRELAVLGRYYMQRRFKPSEGVSTLADSLSVMVKSIAALRAAVDADPDFVDGWTGLALALALRFSYGTDQAAKERSLDDGRVAIQRALALDPDSAEAYAAMGLIHDFERDPVMARAAYEHSLALNADSPMVLRWLSRTVDTFGEFHLAAGYARRAAELAPFSTEFLATAAMSSMMVRDFDSASRFLNAQLHLIPTHVSALNNLIVAHRDAGQLDQAINLGPRLDRALQHPYTIRHMSWLPGMMANIYIQIDAPSSSELLIRQAERDFPNDQYTYWTRSSYLLATENIDGARAHIRNWPVDPELAHLVVAHATMAGLHDYAQQVLDQMPEANGPLPSADPFLVRGKWLTRGQLMMAALPAVYKAYIDDNAGNSSAADALLTETSEFLDYWIQRDVGTPSVLYFRAAIHALQGRPDEGVADLAAAVEKGFRYAWHIRIDPVPDGLRGHPGFAAVLAELEDELARQRALIDLPAGRELYVGSHSALNY
ncbi:MAG: winged helix-turn-helix domain-containing protein [Proteobacteria bacterium]|nr:winged helix-turn-helix domain-containing protein [Pseudomonadota bacterium]